MFKQGDRVRDVVFPLVKTKIVDGLLEYNGLVGTGFLIGKKGYALTAAHVIEQLGLENGEKSSGLFVGKGNKWYSFEVIGHAKHPSEDVAIIKLQGNFHSWLRIHPQSEHQSAEYESWGYPIEVAEQAAKFEESRLERPDLIYIRGYVRRRISRELPVSVYRGKNFYELSDMGGHGCSGGPVILRKRFGSMWSVFGVYIGDNSTGTPVGYAVRAESFENWQPSILTSTIREESEDVN